MASGNTPNEAVKSKGSDTSRLRKKKKSVEGFFVAPDGGWGWVVVLACGLSNFSTVPIIQNFGLIYKEKFEEWKISQAQYSFMRNLEFAVSSCTGLISGALLRKYGFRKISFIGGCLSTISILSTSQVTTIAAFTAFYAVIGGIAFGFYYPANSLAIYTYFKKKRGIATGFAWTITGLSPVLMPQLISVLLEYTDVHGTLLIMAGIALHSLPMALLLQPVKWHGRWSQPEVEDAGKEEPETHDEQQSFLKGQEVEKPHDRKASLKGGQLQGEDEDGTLIVDSQSTFGLDLGGPISRHSSRLSLGSIACPHHRKCENCKCKDDSKNLEVTTKNKYLKEESESEPPKSIWKRMISCIVDLFDLTILKDPKFVIIFVGMTLAFAAEVNFVLFFPFVYAEYGYDKSRVAFFMSILALVDLVTRFTVPLITDKMKLDAKLCYAVGMTILATGRIVLAHADDYNTVLAATIWLGFGKGLRTVFMALVIPSYVPLDRIPTASGLQQLANGVIFLTIGPVFGYLRDVTGNYTLLLHCINILSFTAVGLWVLEYLIERCGAKCRKKEENGMELNEKRERVYPSLMDERSGFRGEINSKLTTDDDSAFNNDSKTEVWRDWRIPRRHSKDARGFCLHIFLVMAVGEMCHSRWRLPMTRTHALC